MLAKIPRLMTAAHGVDVMIDYRDGYTPTPVISASDPDVAISYLFSPRPAWP